MCIVYVCSVLTCSIINWLVNVSYIVSEPCLLYKSFGNSFLSSCSLCRMIATLLYSSVFFLVFFLLMGYLCLFLPHGLTNEYIISILSC